MGEPQGGAPREVEDEDSRQDPRVAAVLEVLAGAPLDDVAARWAVDPVLLTRWHRAFVEAGTAQVTNRPLGDVARRHDRFLTTFMHSLRSPLAIAQMRVGLLRNAADLATVGEIAGHLQQTLDQLDDRATDVELLTAAVLGRLSLDTRLVTVGELVDRLSPAPTVGGEGPQLEVLVDPALFTVVLRDLWDAAVGAGAQGGAVDAVRLEVETVPPWVEVRIVREGAPLDPASLHAMFEPFDQPDGNEQVTVGLYLARALTVVHGGTIGVEQDDGATVFAVRIPDGRRTGAPT